MKTLKFTIILALISFAGLAQSPEKILGTVKYQFINKWEKKEYKATLHFNKHESVFFYGRTQDGSEKREWREVEPNVTVAEIADAEGWTNYIDYKNQKIISRDLIWNKFVIIEEATPKLDWKIADNQKTISQFSCIEATCTFRGRTYHAWFTMDVPMGVGPWKLTGLPGLIVEAYDEEKEYQYRLESINMPTTENSLIEAPKLGKKHRSWDEFNLGRKKKMEEVEKQLLAQVNPDGNSETSIKLDIHTLELFD